MEIIMKEIEAIAFDVARLTSRSGEYHKDIDRGINANHTHKEEGVPKAQTIENLFSYLIDAKHDMDRVGDDLKEIRNKLDDLMEMIEYEKIRKEAGL